MEMSEILRLIAEQHIKFVDLRFTDTCGKEQHISIAGSAVDEELLTQGKAFDGSSIKGWRGIEQSDMILLPQLDTAVKDPFYTEPSLIIYCDVVEPYSLKGYDKDPRTIAKRAEAYLSSTGIADLAYFGPEPEFFVFDGVRFENKMGKSFFAVESDEAAWNSGKIMEGGNIGHRPSIKGGYFPVPPVDSSQDMRSTMSLLLEELGLKVEAHHHEVATANQNEIATRFNTLTNKADEMQLLKYVVHNVAVAYGKTATFMPKPLVGDNGSGMHCHISLAKAGENLFIGDEYAGLSKLALYFIGGVIKHARAINAFSNSTTNSYKRLVPGFEAPVILAYSACNRSAAIRIPYVTNPKATRIEVRYPDAAGNPYLTFAALLMAGIHGIQEKIEPGQAMDQDLYHSPQADLLGVPTVAHSLECALESLDKDRAFLTAGNVFSHDMLDSYIKLKMEEVNRLRMATHPLEFEMYYSS
jgi:glutamine synthetase